MNSPFTAVQAKLRANTSSLYLAMNELDMTSVARIWRNVPVIDFPFCIGAEITCEPIEPVWEPSPPFFFPLFLLHQSPPSILYTIFPLFQEIFFFLFHRSNSIFRNENEPKMISRRLLLSFESICHFFRKDRLKMNKYKGGNWFVVEDAKRWRARSKRMEINVFASVSMWKILRIYYSAWLPLWVWIRG